MGIIEDLVAHPGEYVGLDRDPTSGRVSAARIVVTPLPGGAGVAFDYESFNADNPDVVRGHAEHAVLGRTHGEHPGLFEHGQLVRDGPLFGKDVLAGRVVSLLELTLGGGESSPFPLAIKISVPAPGRLDYVWSYGAPGVELVERDRAELTLSS